MISKEKKYLFLILLLGIFLRIVGIKWSLPNEYHVVTYNCDEYTALTSLQGINPAKWDFNPVSEKHPYALSEGTFNLYTYGALLKILSYAKVITLTTDKEFYYRNIGEWAKIFLVGRLLSVFYGILTVWVIYVLAKKMFGKKTGFLSALFVAIMPAHVVHSRYIIMNVPGVFWIVLAFIFMKNILDSGRTKDYVLAGVCTGLAFATRYSAAPLFLVLILTHILNDNPGKTLKNILSGLSAMVASFLVGAPYTILDFPNFMKGFRAVGEGLVLSSGFSFFGNIFAVVKSYFGGMEIILLLVCILGIFLSVIRRTKEDILLLSWIAILTVIFIRAGALSTPGRILPALPFVAILGARFIDVSLSKWRVVSIVVLVVIFIHSGLFYTAYFRLLSEKDIRDESSEWIIENIKPNSSIGLVREPSWFNPGIIDRKYRHPDHKHLPDYKFVSLTGQDWKSNAGYELFGRIKPAYVIISDVELQLLDTTGFFERLSKYGYGETKRFERMFSVFNLKIKDKIPEMLYIPNTIYVFEKL